METDSTTGWQLAAKCRKDKDKPTSFFYPNLHGLSGPGRAVILRQIGEYCQSCPVRKDCEAAGQQEEHGAWGGSVRDVTIAEFRVQRRRDQRAAAR